MTNIEWTDRSWQVTHGCEKIAAGCRNCYAIRDAHRMAGHPNPKISGPRQGLTRKVGDLIDWTGVVRPAPENLDKPLRWRKPQRIFVNSNSDLFHKDVPFEFIAAVYGVMAACPHHTFQVLTKRPERMREFFEWVERHELCVESKAQYGFIDGVNAVSDVMIRHFFKSQPGLGRINFEVEPPEWPLPNVWHGVSVATQADADKNIPVLLQVPSAIRFVSAEPLVSEVYLQQNWLRASTHQHLRLDIAGALQNKHFRGFMEDGKPMPESAVKLELERRFAAGEKYFPMGDCPEFSTETGCPGHRNPALDWVIVGGESGPGARPFDIAWARSIIQQCKAAGVPVFIKQLGSRLEANFYDECRDDWEELHGGEWPDPYIWTSKPYQPHIDEMVHLKTKDRKGGDPEEWPADLRVREFPASSNP